MATSNLKPIGPRWLARAAARSFIWLQFAPSLAHAVSAPADPPPEELYNMAVSAASTRNYVTAIRLYQAAYQASPKADTIWAIGRCEFLQFQQTANPRAACDASKRFSDYLDATKDVKDKASLHFAEQARAYLDQLEPYTGKTRERCVETVPPPPPTQIMVRSDTPGATISIDGQAVSASPVIRDVSADEHVVAVTAKGYAPIERHIRVANGQIVTSQIELLPLPGAIQVGANETGAEVYVDGLKVGTTPFSRGGFQPGPHSVAVRQSGRILWTTDVDLAPAGSASTTALLQPSRQRTMAGYALVGAGAALTAGIITGLAAYSVDSSLDNKPASSGPERENYDSRWHLRNAFATSSTVLFSLAGAALIAAGGMYWLDTPPTPSAGAPRDTAQPRRTSVTLGPNGLRF
jgi:hypothetical protein